MLCIAIFSALLVTGSAAINLPDVDVAINFNNDNDETLSSKSDDFAVKYADEYVGYVKSGIESARLRQLTQQLSAIQNRNSVPVSQRAEDFFFCTTCRATLNVFTRMFRDPQGELNGPNKREESKKLMLDICDRLNIETQEVCEGHFELNWDFFDYIMQNSLADTRTMCGMIFPMSFCKIKQPEFNWTAKVDGNGPSIDAPKSDIPNKSDNDWKVLHLTDIHYDPDYVVGSLAVCPESMCCRKGTPATVEKDKQAGYWGDHVCDLPLHTIEGAFDHIKKTHEKIDFIYHTGDVIPHNQWSTTKEGNIEIIKNINDLIAEKFPGIPVYSCVGNHEPSPADVFGAVDLPENLNVKWLYDHLYTSWSKWLPETTKDTILKGGYYTVSPKPGFRIISLNNNDCYLYNWWVFLDGRLIIDQLEWLHDTLLAAEKAGEYVHILAHHPSGDADCWTDWSREYKRIIQRFHHIISGIFNGHTHVDEINVHYSTTGHAVGVAWNGGSLTSFTNKNPNYVVYDIEPSSLQVVDYETWIMNLTDANQHGAERPALWQRLYQFSDEFTTNLSPAGIDALLDKMAANPALLRKFWTYKMTAADHVINRGCNDKCLLSTICRLATDVYNQMDRCKELQAKLEKSLASETTTTTTTEGTTTPKDEGDGASAITAFKVTSMLGLLCLVRMLY